MAPTYTKLDLSTVEPEPSEKSGTPTVYLTDALDLTEMRATVRTLGPGQTMPYHHHESQEELYLLLAGTGSMTIVDERVDVTPGTAVRVSPETPRQLRNDSDDECSWLIVGAPPIEGEGTVLGPGPETTD